MIIDCVMASYETDALRVRDAELADVVDLRVIVVGTTDFRGNPAQPLGYWDKDAKTETYVFPVPLLGDSPWDREFYLRNQSFEVARQYGDPGAWYIVSDADEIPHPEAILDVQHSRNPGTLMTDYRQWYMDWRAPDSWQLERQPLMAKARHHAHVSPSNARISVWWPKARKRGWHLSNLNDIASRKLSTFSHTEYDTPEFNDAKRLADFKEQGLDILDRFALEATEDLPSCADQFPHLVRARIHEETMARLRNAP